MSKPESPQRNPKEYSLGVVRGAKAIHFTGSVGLADLFWISPNRAPIAGVTTDDHGEVIAVDIENVAAVQNPETEMNEVIESTDGQAKS